MVSFGGQWAVEADQIASSPQLVEADIFHTELDQALIVDRVEADHLTAEVPQQTGDECTDPPGADNSGRFPRKVESDQAVQREVAVSYSVVGLIDAAIEGEDQRNRVFGDGVRRIGRHANDGHPQPLGGLEVDVVVSRAPQCDVANAKRGQNLEHLGIDHVVDENAHRIGPGGERRRS